MNLKNTSMILNINSNKGTKFFILVNILVLGLANKGLSQAPIINYTTPQVYSVGTPIPTLTPTNTGGAAIPNGQTSTFAGNGSTGSANGVGTAASFNQPLGNAVDAQGNVYVADAGTHLIRKITPSGMVSTLAGSGFSGSTNGTGTAASFYHPVGLTVDGSGNVYVADEDNNLIRKISPLGVVSTLAGSGAQGSANGTGTAASFYYPCGVAVDMSGNVYVADYNNNLIRKISASGTVSTFAGNGTVGSANGTGTAATFNHPFSVTVDNAGNVYVADRLNHVIRKISSTGLVTTLAGSGSIGSTDGTGSSASFYYPTTVTVDGPGNVYVADESNNKIRKITPSGVVSTISGTGAQGSTNGIGNAATFYNPFTVAVDGAGYIYVGDYSNNLIRKVVSTAFTITPSLPTGLVLDGATGRISGTPIVTSPLTAYTIYGYNSYGFGSTTLTITVNQGLAINPSQDKNYMITYKPELQGITSNSILNANIGDRTKIQTNIQYFDALGRPSQTIQVKGSPSGRDVVQPFRYSQFDTDSISYLPYVILPASSSDGSFRPNAISDQASFYNSSSPGAPYIATTQFPYSERAIDQSPLNRPVEQGAVGDSWQLTGKSGAVNPGHTIKTSYATNNNITWGLDSLNSFQVALYTATTNINQVKTLVRNNQATYVANQLYVTVTTGENWKNGRAGKIEEYKDKLGNLILKRMYNYEGQLKILSTYYVYDERGNVAFVLPPGARPDSSAVISQNTLDNFCFQYRYDEWNRVSQKKAPGKGWEFFIYNSLDQVVASQDSLQRFNKQWIFNKYDSMGRLIMTGVWNNGGTSISISALQSSINSQTVLFETPLYPGNGYSNIAWPTTNTSLLAINYYDSYSNIPGLPASYVAPTGALSSPTGLITASQTNVLGSTDMLLAVHYYDPLGRNVLSYQQHYLGGVASIYNYDVVANSYYFTNALYISTRQHYVKNLNNNGATLSVTVAATYYYDHLGRKIQTWEQVNNGSNILLVQDVYNEIGQTLAKKYHSINNGTDFLQTIDYRYNTRGWLTSINNANLSNDYGVTNNDNKDQFGMEISYDASSTSSPNYNGNISTIKWKTAGIPSVFTSTQLGYDFRYDKQNQLMDAVSSTNGIKDGNYSEFARYDNMGNIQKLGRYAFTGVKTHIDSLNYSYNGNQYIKIDDNTGNNTYGFKDGVQVANEYTYDGNGNLIQDLNKSISSITYNLLNLPKVITLNNGTATYTYDASGIKISKGSVVNGATVKTEYVNGIEYYQGAISSISTEAGRLRPNGTNYNFEYDLQDHLGNNRVIVMPDPSDITQMTPKIIQVNSYYPFGYLMPGQSYFSGLTNEYQFNKKEYQEESLLYDYGARFYDPVIARWTSIDPMAAKYSNFSPYVYCKDNPVSFFDFEGGDVTPAQYRDFFLNYAVSLYDQAKSRGASTEGALTLVSQLALESGYATNSGALKHKNPYSLMPGGKMATFSDYGSATTAFFNNLDKNWPTAMTALSGDVTADALDKAYHTGDYEKLGGAYMERDKVNNYDYGTKILGANSSISRRFIKALDQGIADNNAIISADSKLISSDLSQIQDLVSKGDLDGAAKVSQHLNKTAKESNAAQNKNDTYGRIKSDLQNNQ